MSLDGLRAWIGEVERKLSLRTRVFLVLAAIAVGGAGTGVYLGIDAQNDQVTEGDLQAVQQELQEEVEALGAKVEGLESQVAATSAESATGGLGADLGGRESEAKTK
jgi:uncharacterized protein HemX